MRSLGAGFSVTAWVAGAGVPFLSELIRTAARAFTNVI
jgi:hypothetical protein